MATRRERVVLALEDDFTPGMARAAAATALLKRELNDLSGRAVGTSRTTKQLDKDIDHAGRTARKAGGDFEKTGNQIDRLSGRMRILAEAVAILGPGLVPIAAAAVPAVAGLANAFGFTVVAAGTSVLALHGVGDALKALNDYQLQPTAAHLQALHEKMQALGPAGRDFVRELQALRPELQHLQSIAQAGLLPGLTEAIDVLMQRLPDVERIIGVVSDTLGDLSVEGAKALAGPEWDDFFRMLETQARPTLTDLGHAIGDVTAGLADLWVAFAPLNRDFSRGLANMASSFHDWASGLSQTKGFADFMAYLRETGPQVLDTLGSLALAVVDIGRAAAPLGGPVLHAVQAFAEAISAIARSDLGTPIFTALAALSLYNRALAITAGLQATAFGGQAIAGAKGLAGVLRQLPGDLALLGTTAMTAGARTERELARTAASAGRLKMVLAALGKGLELAAVVEGVNLLDREFEKLMHLDIGNSQLMTGLENLGRTGKATGELAKTYGDDLDRFGKFAGEATSGFENFKQHLIGILPGKTTLDIANDQIKQADSALATMVQSGNLQQARAAFQQLAKAAAQHGVSMEDLKRLMPQYTAALGEAATVDGKGASAADKAAAAQRRYTQAILANLEAMREKRTAALAAGNAEIAYQQALDDARKAAKDNGRTLDINTQKGRDNKTALLQIAAAWNQLSDRQQNAKGAFAAARKALIDQAVQMGATRRAAERYADQLLNIPKDRKTLIQVNGIDPAIASVKELQRYIDSLHGKTITNYLRTIVSKGPVAGGGHPLAPPAGADGMTVPGQRHPYGDKVLALLAPGEEVISNRHGQADAFRRDRATGRIPAYADGGTAGETAAERKKRREEEAARRKARHARHLQLQGYANSFDLVAGMSIASLNRELSSFSLSVRKAGGHLSADFGRLSKRAREIDRAYLKSQDVLKRETKLRDDLLQRRDQSVSSAQGAFTSDVFSGSLGGLSFMLGRDTRNAAAMDAALRAAKAKGLDGALAQGLAASGNLRLAQQFAGLSKSQIAGYEKQFAARQAATSALGQTTAAFFAPQIAAANAQIRASQATEKRLTKALNNLEKAIENGTFRKVDIHTKENPDKIAKAITKRQRHHGRG